LRVTCSFCYCTPLALIRKGGFLFIDKRHISAILIYMIGININDKHQLFTEQILNGSKTIETRSSKSLHPYIGKMVGIIRTGKGKATLVGYITIKAVKKYCNNFDDDYGKHLVAPTSLYHGQDKWGYILCNPVRCSKERLITSRGIISRKIA
jgi:hypothetical protein